MQFFHEPHGKSKWETFQSFYAFTSSSSEKIGATKNASHFLFPLTMNFLRIIILSFPPTLSQMDLLSKPQPAHSTWRHAHISFTPLQIILSLIAQVTISFLSFQLPQTSWKSSLSLLLQLFKLPFTSKFLKVGVLHPQLLKNCAFQVSLSQPAGVKPETKCTSFSGLPAGTVQGA